MLKTLEFWLITVIRLLEDKIRSLIKTLEFWLITVIRLLEVVVTVLYIFVFSKFELSLL